MNQRNKLRIVISIDDVHPAKHWRILGDKTEKWLRTINEKYGAKFTCFVPSNYHNQFPLSKHKEWVQELASMDFVEIACHGHLHMTSDPKRFGECEMLELDTDRKCMDRFREMFNEWENGGYLPSGWKNPGWLCHPKWNEYINGMYFDYTDPFVQYVSLHYEHNQGMKWDCKTFFGHDGIQQTNISIHNSDMIMLTSHIAGNWNHNVWNEDNFEQLCLSLDHLVENYDCEFKTLCECI